VTDKLPEKMRPTVESRMRSAYAAGTELEAKAQLEAKSCGLALIRTR